jgi:cytochrome c55X
MTAISKSLGLLAAAGVLLAAGAAARAEPEQARRSYLEHMVLQDCGSCHGMTLKGGLGPALTVEALHGKPGETLVAAILSGRPGTAMPPWRPFMSEQEAVWIVEQLQKGAIRAH